MTLDFILEIFGLLVGLLYLFWEYRADPRFWIASMVMPCISMWLYFSKGIYADFAINIYYLVIAVYGYWNWTRRDPGAPKTAKPEVRITRITWRTFGLSVLGTCALWALISWVLINFTDSTIPYADGFTTALSIVAMWLGARKIAEQWIAWLIVDAVTVPIQLSKGLIFYPCLYALYTVIAVFGYLKWLRLSRAATDPVANR